MCFRINEGRVNRRRFRSALGVHPMPPIEWEWECLACDQEQDKRIGRHTILCPPRTSWLRPPDDHDDTENGWRSSPTRSDIGFEPNNLNKSSWVLWGLVRWSEKRSRKIQVKFEFPENFSCPISRSSNFERFELLSVSYGTISGILPTSLPRRPQEVPQRSEQCDNRERQ